MRKLCLVFLCLTAIAIKGQVRDDKPIIYEPTVKISFSSSDASHPMLLYIDGVRKDSITAYPGGSYSCNLKYGTHTIVATAQDMEDYKESITVNKTTASWYPIKAETWQNHALQRFYAVSGFYPAGLFHNARYLIMTVVHRY